MLLVLFILILIILFGLIIYIASPKNGNFTNGDIIVPNIVGGLGNQLYFVAQAYIYGKKHNKNLVIKKKSEYASYGKPRPIYYDTVFNKLTITDVNTENFTHLSENELDIYKEGNIYMTGGYFQKTKYIVPYLSELQTLFTPPDNITMKIDSTITDNMLNTMNDIVIHIRLADDWTPKDFGNIYTPDEINKIKEFIKNDNNKIILFSNNIPKALELLDLQSIANNTDKIFIPTNTTDYEELYLMARFRRFIASPSTFNIWGIMLSKYQNKEINILWDIKINNYRIDFYEQYSYLLSKESNYTCVSGYYNVKNKHNNKFKEWFKNTLNIDSNYVIFTDSNSYDIIKPYRKLNNTKYIFKNLNDFTLKKSNYNENHTEPTHVPSIELGLIWLNKIEMMKIASEINYYNSDWFVWIDAGISSLRDVNLATPLKLNIDFNNLDKNKFYYGSSSNDIDIVSDKWEYIHNVQGGFFILYKNMINKAFNLFMDYHKKCLSNINNYICMSDQVIWSHIKNDNNDMFVKLCDGY